MSISVAGWINMKRPGWLSKWLIAPLIAAVMILTLIAGATVAFYSDQETSTGNTSTAWTSAQWTQTSQTDFSAGVPSNVDITTSPGDAILLALTYGSGSGANMILLWDGPTTPSGWTLVSDVGGAFYRVFPRGAATYGGTGGAATHTHTVSFVSENPGATDSYWKGTDVSIASAAHTHGLSSGSTVAASNLPSYRNIQVIQYNSGMPTTIPAGAIAIFDNDAPAGWTRENQMDNYFVRGENPSGGTGGSNTHTHTANIGLGASAGTDTLAPKTGALAAGISHTHSGSGTTASGDNRPPYISVILAKADSDTAIPSGMIAMFDDTPSGAWSVLSDTGGPFNSKFIVGSSSYGTPGGADTHTHSNLAVTTGGPSATQAAELKAAQTVTATDTHTHSVTVSFNSPNHLPPYRDVIFAKATAQYASSGTIASQVLDTTVSGSGWDGLAWDRTLPSGTNITLEVRASDTPFLKTDASPSWTVVGSTSPVISALPPGRYKQWRAILTPDGARTSTPTLSEVRVYYYGG